MNERVAIVALVVVALCVSAGARTWTSRKGSHVEAEFDRTSAGQVVLKTADGQQVQIELADLSDEDQKYVAAHAAASATNAVPHVDAAKGPDADAFMAVINHTCVHCHKKACASLDSMIEAKWIVPGHPEKSPCCNVIGKHKKPDGKYHDLSDKDKQVVLDFVKTCPSAAK